MTKKILTFVLIFTLVASSVYALPNDLWSGDERIDKLYGQSQIEAQKSDMLLDLLDYLGIVEKEEFNPDRKAEYSNFVKAVSIIAAGSDSLSEDDLVSRGYIFRKASGKTLRPSDVLYSGLMLTGYNQLYDNLDGSDSAAILAAAQSAGLAKYVDVSGDSALTGGDFVQIIYNILSVETKSRSTYGGDSYLVTDDSPLLIKQFDIELRNGVVTGIHGSSIYSGNKIEEDEIAIDKIIYRALDTDSVYHLLGMNVDYFLKDGDTSRPILLFAQASGYNNQVVELMRDDISDNVTDREIVYFDKDGKSRKLSLDANTAVVYNGAAAGAYSASLFNKYAVDGTSVTAVANSGDKKTDVLFIWNYTDYPVETDVDDNGIIRFKYSLELNGLKYLDLSKLEDTVTDIYIDGKKGTASDIKEGNIASIAQSTNTVGKKYLKVMVSTQTLMGTLTSESDDGGMPEYEINGANYRISHTFAQMCKTNNTIPTLTSGKTYKISLNYLGEIGDVSEEEACVFGFIMDMGVEGSFNVYTGQIKMFTKEGKIEYFPMAEKINVHYTGCEAGERLEPKKVEEKFNELYPVDNRAFVKYALNNNKEVSEIYFPIDNIGVRPGQSGYPMTLDYDSAGTTGASHYQGVLAYKYRVLSSMPLFSVPPAEYADNEKLYSIKSLSYASSHKRIKNLSVYGVDDFYFAGAALAYDTSVTFSDTATPVVVEKIIRSLDDDGNEALAINGYQKGAKVKLFCNDEALVGEAQSGWYPDVKITDLKCGDVIQVQEIAKHIERFRVLFRGSDPGQYREQHTVGTKVDPGTGFENLVVSYGVYVGNRDEMFVTNSDLAQDPNKTISHFRNVNSSSFYCYLVEQDGKNKTVKAVTPSELLPGDRVVVQKYYLEIGSIIAYRGNFN